MIRITNINVKESTLKTVSLSDLKTDLTFKKLSDHYLPNLIQDLDETNYLKSSTNDFIITSDTINVVEKENYKSYTIRIKRNTESSYTVENLVLEQRDSLQKAFIFSYEFEPEWIVEFLGDKKTPPKGKVSIEEYDINNLKSSYQKSGFCAWVDIWITFPCGCGHYSRPPCKGSTCGGRFWPQKEIHSVYYCDSTGDGFFDLAGGGGTGGGGSGGGGGFGGPSGSSDGSETGMVMEDTTELMLYGVMVDLANSLGLSPVQRDWVLDPANYIYGLQLNDFLDDNEDSQEAEGFASDAINALMDNAEVDFSNRIILNQSIIEDPCVKNIIKQSYENKSDLANTISNAFNSFNSGNISLTFNASDLEYSGQVGGTNPELELLSSLVVSDQGLKEYNINITFDTDFLEQATDIGIAATSIHEQVHAYLIYLYETNILQIANALTPNPSYQELIQAFALYQETNDEESLTITQHDYMTNLVDDMAEDLYAFAQLRGLTNVDEEYCKKLIWGSLDDTLTFENKFPKFQSDGSYNPDYIEINQATLSEAKNEVKNYTHSDGTLYSNSPKGTPCN